MQVQWLVLVVVLLTVVIFMCYQHRKMKRARTRILQLEKLNIQKDKLFTVIGHDLNGLVNMGHAGLRMYRSDGLPEQDKTLLLDELEERFLGASVMLQSFLNWGKLLFKGILFSPITFNAPELIEAELMWFQAVIRNKKIEVLTTLPASLEVYADIDHFKFIIRNLLSNAIKFTRVGGVIRIDLQEQQDGFAIIGVADNGVGMSEEKMQQIFYPFDSSTDGTSREKGNGIGLMLCKEYAKENGGDIWVRSKSGIGTTFYLSLKTASHNVSSYNRHR